MHMHFKEDMGVIERIEFERLRAGEYQESISDFRSYFTHPLPRTRGHTFTSMEREMDAEKSMDVEELFAASEALEDTRSMKPDTEVRKLGSLHVASAVAKKPDAITLLEQVLTAEYHIPVRVTRIRDLPQTRKKVKEVCILKGNALGRVWVLHDDPKVLYKELVVSYFASREHVPTGKPLAFSPDAPFKADIGILGGSVIEHAGDAYTELLQRLERAPDVMLKTALGVASTLALCHAGLQKSKKSLSDYGIDAPRYSFEHALHETLGRTLNGEHARLERLAHALYCPARSYMINHGDVHTGNIVTMTAQNGSTGPETLIDQFGIIDWSDICTAHPIRDIVDFWVHHVRAVRSIFPRYEEAWDIFIAEYGRASKERTGNEFRSPRVDELILHRVQRDVLELFDPARTDPQDIADKARYHAWAIAQNLQAYRAFNPQCTSAAVEILADMLAPFDYLKEPIQRMKA